MNDAVEKVCAGREGEQHPDAKSEMPFWVGTRGELSHRSSVVRLLNKYAYQAGIEAFNPHTLRHTFAGRYDDLY